MKFDQRPTISRYDDLKAGPADAGLLSTPRKSTTIRHIVHEIAIDFYIVMHLENIKNIQHFFLVWI